MERGSGPVGLAILVSLAACAGAPEGTFAGRLSIVQEVLHLDGLALREPMVVEHPAGALFAAGYSRAPGEFTDPPNLYVSHDGGGSWEPVDVGTPEEGALGNSDVDLAVAPDGTLYFLAMGFDRAVGEGTHVAVGVSRDVGRSWTWTFLSRDRFDDRPWIAVAPDGVAHVVWNDGSGVSHAVSPDGGATWTERPRIHSRGGSSHLAVGPAGELAVRITPPSASGNRFDPGVDLVAVSADGGESWQKRDVPGERVWDPVEGDPRGVPRWVEPVAWDGEGALYALWSEGRELRIARSPDRGATWEVRPLLEGEDLIYYPWLVVSSTGELGMSWFSGFGEELRAHVGLVRFEGGSPSLRTTAPRRVDAWAPGPNGSGVRDPAGEYFPVVFLADGDLGSVLPVQRSARGDGFVWLRISR